MDVLADLLDNEERVLPKPEPRIFVSELGDSAIEITMRPWSKREDWLALTQELPRLIRLRFAEEGIEIPYPQMDLHVRRGTATGEDAEDAGS